MSQDHEEARSFSGEFDDEFPLGPEEGSHAFFGRNVLAGWSTASMTSSTCASGGGGNSGRWDQSY